MKTIGLIGGTTCHSSIDYYSYINELVNKQLGGDQAARVILNSVNFGEIKELTFKNDWDNIANIICKAAQKHKRQVLIVFCFAPIQCIILQIRYSRQLLSR